MSWVMDTGSVWLTLRAMPRLLLQRPERRARGTRRRIYVGSARSSKVWRSAWVKPVAMFQWS